jgi:large subunit ribosomal protein L3
MNTNLGLIGKKLGCTQIFDSNGNVARVTVVEAGPCVVVRKRTMEKDGYVALQIAFGEKRASLVNKPMTGYFSKNGIQPRSRTDAKGKERLTFPRTIKELRLSAEDAARFEVGATISVGDVFKEGQLVDVTGTSKGRGFAGVIKRHHFAGMVDSHGTHEYFRHGGSIGTNMTPGRTLPGLRMPGHLGATRSTMQNLRVVKVLPEQNLVLIEGSAPGANNGIVTVRGAVKARRA